VSGERLGQGLRRGELVDEVEFGGGFDGEVEEALEAGRWLEDAAETGSFSMSAGFADRVMASLATEAAPAAAGFLVPVRRDGLVSGFLTSVQQAWSAFGGSGRPALARGAALAYVLVVAIAGVSLTGAVTIGAGRALGLFGPGPTASPTPISSPPVSPAPSIPPETMSPSPSVPVTPSPTPSTTPTPSPSESSEASDDHGGNSGPGGGGAEPSDDHGGSSGSDGGGDDHSGPSPTSGSGGNSGPGSSSGTSGSSGSGGGDDHATSSPDGSHSGPG
jgi:hypothetical protein